MNKIKALRVIIIFFCFVYETWALALKSFEVNASASQHCLISSPYPLLGLGCRLFEIGGTYSLNNQWAVSLSYSQDEIWSALPQSDKERNSYRSTWVESIKLAPEYQIVFGKFMSRFGFGLSQSKISISTHTGGATMVEKEPYIIGFHPSVKIIPLLKNEMIRPFFSFTTMIPLYRRIKALSTYAIGISYKLSPSPT